MNQKIKTTDWKTLNPAQIIIDPEYPSEFTSTDLDIYINLAKIPAEMPFDDLVFHVNRAILTETICWYMNHGHPKKSECGARCRPSEIARYFMKWMGFAASFDFYDDYKSYLEGVKQS